MLLHGTVCSYVWRSILFFRCCLCWQYCRVRYSGYCWCWEYCTQVCGVLNTASTGEVWAVRVLKAQILRVLGDDEQHRTPSTARSIHSTGIRNGWSIHRIKSAEPVDISSARSIYSRNTACTLSTWVPPPKVVYFNTHSFVGPSVNSKSCLQHIADEIIKRRCTGRWSRYASYAQYTANIESILVLLRVPVLAVPTGRNTATSWQYPQYRSLKYFKYSSFPQHSIVQS